MNSGKPEFPGISFPLTIIPMLVSFGAGGASCNITNESYPQIARQKCCIKAVHSMRQCGASSFMRLMSLTEV